MVPGYRPRWKTALPLDWESMEKKSTFGLTPSQLGRLLAASALDPESADTMADDQTNERLLQRHLSRRLAEELSFEKALLSGAGRPAGETRVLLDRSLKETLLDPQCDLSLLRAVKEYGKRLSAMVTSRSETLITTTIYYAAIAAALACHNRRISQYSREDLADRFSKLAQRPWMDKELQGLFARAAEICRRTKTDAP
jgi:hypothetical protein